jgi:hypothetical protein
MTVHTRNVVIRLFTIDQGEPEMFFACQYSAGKRYTEREKEKRKEKMFFLSFCGSSCLPACRSLMEESGSLDIHQQSSSSTQLSAILL